MGLVFYDVETQKLDQTIAQRVHYFLTALRLGQCYHAWYESLDDSLRLADPPPEPPEHVWRETREAVTDADVRKWCRAYYRHRRRQTAGPAMELPPSPPRSAGNHK
jgi:hypothetical protein